MVVKPRLQKCMGGGNVAWFAVVKLLLQVLPRLRARVPGAIAAELAA